MATHKSAVKKHKQNLKRRQRHLARRTRIKNLTKDFMTAVDAGDGETAKKTIQEAIPTIQKALSKGTIHRNTAARKISRLTRKHNSLQSGQ